MESVTTAFQAYREAFGRAPTVLLVEDEEELANVISGALKMRGIEVIPAQDGTMAIELFRARNSEITMVLSDVVMPRLNGRELLERLKRIDAQVKVIFMSGQPREDALMEVPSDAYCGWLQKPFSLKELLETIKTALDVGPGS